VEQNGFHLVRFGIFSRVNFRAPLYSFRSDLEVLSINVINQENIFIIETYFRSHPFAINRIWNFDVYFEVRVPVERHIVFLQG
jgi:hypothetical protein